MLHLLRQAGERVRRFLIVLFVLLATSAAAQDAIWFRNGQMFFAIEPSANRVRVASGALFEGFPLGGGPGGTPGGSPGHIQFNLAGAFAGTDSFTLSGSTVNLGANTDAGSVFVLNSGSGARSVYWRTNGLSRWSLQANATAESGGNAGSDLELSSYNDAGTALVAPVLTVTRNTGDIAFGSPSAAHTVTFPRGTSSIVFEGATADNFETTLGVTDPTADRTITLPNITGDVAVLAATGYAVRTAAGAWAARAINCGIGVLCTNGDAVSSNTALDIDSAVVNTFTSGTGSVPGTGGLGTHYYETDRPAAYVFPAPDIEHWLLSIAPGVAAGDLFQTSATDTLAAITSTDDNVLVSNGSTWEKKALPSCTDSLGKHLNYDTATNSYSCGTSSSGGGGGSFDPSTTVDLYDEFMTGLNASGQAGSLGWTSNVLNSGTCSGLSSRQDHPGTYVFTTINANNNSGCDITPGTGSITTANTYGSRAWTMDAVVYFGTAGDASANTAFFFGWANSGTSLLTATDMIGWERDTSLSQTAFVAHVCDSATSGCQSAGADTNQEIVTSSISMVDNTAYRFRMSFDPVGGPGATKKLTVNVNNESDLTFCSSGCTTTISQFPAATSLLPVVGFIERATGENKSAEIDYFRLIMNPVRY
jgi:hypothetical protein